MIAIFALVSRHSRKLTLKLSPLKQIGGKVFLKNSKQFFLFSSFNSSPLTNLDASFATAFKHLNDVVFDICIEEILSAKFAEGGFVSFHALTIGDQCL